MQFLLVRVWFDKRKIESICINHGLTEKQDLSEWHGEGMGMLGIDSMQLWNS